MSSSNFFRNYLDIINENSQPKVQLDEGVMDDIKSTLMSKLAPKLSSQEKSKMAAVAKNVLGKDSVDSSDFTLANIKAVSKALGAKPESNAQSIQESPIGDGTLGQKLVSLTGTLGGAAATIAVFFGGPAWLIIPGVLAMMFFSIIGTDKSSGEI
jgi:hypothetical protein